MFKLAIIVTATCVAAVSAQSDTCRACNCQFNNVQVLDQLIEDRIATGLLLWVLILVNVTQLLLGVQYL